MTTQSPMAQPSEIELKLFRAIANTRHYGRTRTVGETNEDMWYESTQRPSINLVKRIKDIYEPIIAQSEKRAELDVYRKILTLNPTMGLIHVDSYDESDSGDGYVFETLNDRIKQLESELKTLEGEE